MILTASEIVEKPQYKCNFIVLQYSILLSFSWIPIDNSKEKHVLIIGLFFFFSNLSSELQKVKKNRLLIERYASKKINVRNKGLRLNRQIVYVFVKS